jgi:Mn2+/Fe2+ NRAMP family transporter
VAGCPQFSHAQQYTYEVLAQWANKSRWTWNYFLYVLAESATGRAALAGYWRSRQLNCAGLKIILYIYLQSRQINNKLGGMWNYFLYVLAESATGRAALSSGRAALSRYWRSRQLNCAGLKIILYIYLQSRQINNKLGGMWNYFLYVLAESATGRAALAGYWRSAIKLCRT